MVQMMSVQLVETPNWRLRSTLRALHSAWPNVFDQYLPLKVGIHEEILAANLGLSREAVEEALDCHVNTREYLENVAQKHSCRFDLKGNVVEEIAQKQRDFAIKKLEMLR